MGFVVNYPPVTKVTVDETTNEVVVAAAGPRGPQGDPGVVAATAPLTYDSGTQTVALDESGIEIAPSQVTGTAVVDNDSRLSDARTPTAHATSHEDGGSDELTLAQSQVTGLVSDLAGKLANPSSVDADINGVTVGRGSGDVSTNTVVGSGALGANSTGFRNTSVGENALQNNDTGNFNTAVGQQALRDNTGGDSNTAMGLNSSVSVTTGDENVAVGFNSLFRATTANENTAIGTEALRECTSGSDNTATGRDALRENTTGFDNTAIGYQSGNTNTSGHNNTFIGHDAVGASATANDTITLGDSAVTTLRCQVTTITSLSDRRDKKNIQPATAGLSFVEQLEPVTFDWDMRNGKKRGVPGLGFIAQDLLQVMEDTGIEVPELVSQENPDALEAGYGALIPVLVQAIKELSAKVDRLEAQC